MRPRVLFGIAGIIVFTVLVMINFSRSINSYVDFEQAGELNGDRIHVVGTWDSTQPASFSNETMTFTFYMTDESGNTRRVTYPRPKPNNFEQADQIVVIGEMRGDTFVSRDMLVKCPSKYNDAATPELSEL
ncbi:MAG: cytochrome c maturation protein CcmE [Balneolales bacterium]